MAKKPEEIVKGKELQLVIFRLRSEEFGTEIASVLEISRVLEITRIPQAPGFIEGVVNLRGQVIAVIDLAKQFGLPPQPELPKTARIIIAEVAGETIGLIVDEVPEVLRVGEETIEPTPEIIQAEIKRDYLRGVAKSGDRLILLLDLQKVLASQELEAVGKMIQP